jgi:hypothetical protein
VPHSHVGLSVRELRTNPNAFPHIEECLRLTGMDRSRLDLPLVLAIACRESSVSTVFSTLSRSVVSSGRVDGHPDGVGGLDYLWTELPGLRDELEMRKVPRSQLTERARRRRSVPTPARLPERNMLAAYMATVAAREERFMRVVTERFGDASTRLLASLSSDARRAWIQMAFGSNLDNALNFMYDRYQQQHNNQILNEILTSEELLSEPLGSQCATRAVYCRRCMDFGTIVTIS